MERRQEVNLGRLWATRILPTPSGLMPPRTAQPQKEPEVTEDRTSRNCPISETRNVLRTHGKGHRGVCDNLHPASSFCLG